MQNMMFLCKLVHNEGLNKEMRTAKLRCANYTYIIYYTISSGEG